jgi:hypothetical protein
MLRLGFQGVELLTTGQELTALATTSPLREEPEEYASRNGCSAFIGGSGACEP